ncbi:hypothetical protein BsWGS_04618 [Bradybaena similaris]
MELEERMRKIVFLIDTSLAICTDNNHLSEVILLVFRILSSWSSLSFSGTCREKVNNSYLNSTTPVRRASCVNVKWGFKFFNTTKTISRNRSGVSSLKSFKLAHVEDFDRLLTEAFTAEKEDAAVLPVPKTNPKRNALHPAELLSTALTETLYDFQWTAHDILTSPVSRRQNNFKVNDFTRSIFVFTKAPCTKKSLRHFANKMVLDSDVLIDSFMSPALLNEYQQKMKISLSCVDFSSPNCKLWNNFTIQDESTAESVSILRDTFRRLKGSFISKDVILGCAAVTDDDADCSDSSIDPIQISNIFPHEAFLTRLKVNEKPPNEVTISATLSSKGFQCLPVHLIPMTLKQNPRSQADLIIKTSPNNTPRSSAATVGTSEEKCINKSLSLQQINLVDVHFNMLGCVPLSLAGDLLTTCMSPSFILACNDGDLVSSLLHQIADSGHFGVLDITNGGRPLLTLALLQAYSGTLGCITLLNLNATLGVEKLLFQQYNTSFTDDAKGACDIMQDNDRPHTLSFMERLHNDIQKLKASVKTAPAQGKVAEKSCAFQPHCMNSWHVAGSTGEMASLVSKISDRVHCVDSKSKNGFLKQLRRHYIKERHPLDIIKCSQPVSSTPVCGLVRVRTASSGGSESGSTSSYGCLKNFGSLSLSRGRMMVNRARSSTFAAAEDDNDSFLSRSRSPKRKRSSSTGFIDLDLKTKDDLKNYLQKQYDQVLKAGVAMEISAQTMVTVTARFMSKMQLADPQQASVSFINECLELSCSKTKEKYSQTSEGNKGNIVTEYKLQVILLLEMESLLRDADTVNHKILNEIVSMLRAVSFLTNATNMTAFLADIVASYSAALPKLLVDIFDELMLPLPPALAKFASPATPSSVSETHLSHTNDASFLHAPMSSQPPSHLSDQSSQQAKRFNKFKQHPSFSDFRQKKQILVKPKPKPKVETRKAVTDKTTTRSSSKARRLVDCERAKRNLFSDTQSSSRVKTRSAQKRRRSASKTSRTLVLGTPVHKQTSQRHLWQQERRRQRENIQPDVQVIAETPVKDDDDDEGNNEDSTLNRPARYIVREAFYSSNTQPSRNLVKSFELAEKNDVGRDNSQGYVVHSSKPQGTLSSAVRGESPILSPRSRLIRTFLSSPSPTPKTKLKDKHVAKSARRCSPRKSAKKLLFSDSDKKDSNVTRPADTGYAHLIYDGENANDFSSDNGSLQPAAGEKKKAKHFPMLGVI